MLPALAILDMIGTTVAGSDRVTVVFEDALRLHGLQAGAGAVGLVRGLNKDDAFRRLARAAGIAPERVEAVAADLHRTFRDRLRVDLDAAPPAPLPGVEAALRWFAARGVPVVLASGLDRAYVDAVLARLGWTPDLVRATVCAEDVRRGRPAPDLILAAMARVGVVDPAQVLVVGDTVADLQAAAAAGVRRAVGVRSGAGSAADLAAAPHAAILDGVADLPAWLSAPTPVVRVR